MSWRKTIILGLLFLTAGAGYFADRSLTQKRELVKQRVESLSLIQKEEVTAFTLKNRSGTFRLEKKGQEWRILEPQNLKTDMDQVDSLLSNITVAKKYDPVETSDLAQYGLDKPKETLTLEAAGATRKQTLHIGLESTTPGRYFATIEGEKTVFTVASHVKNFLDKNLFHLRDKTIFDIKKEDITKLEIDQTGTSVTLQKNDRNFWVMSSPVQDAADKRAMDNLLSDIETLRATSFEEDQTTTPGFYGLDQALLLFTITAKEPVTLQIGREEPSSSRYFARKKDSGPIFSLPKRFVDEIGKAPGEFRSRDIFKMASNDIYEIKLIVGESFVSLVKDEAGVWHFSSEPEIPAHKGRVEKLLSDIAGLRIASFIEETPSSLAPYGLDAPRARVILYPKDKKDKEILSFGNKAEGKDVCYARISTRPFIFGVDWTKVSDFYMTRQDLQDRRILPIIKDTIYKIDLVKQGKKRILERRDDRWFAKESDEDKGKEVPAYEVFGVLADITELEFDSEMETRGAESPGIPSGEAFLVQITLFDKTGGTLEVWELQGSADAPTLTLKNSKGKNYLIRHTPFQKILDDFNTLFKTESKEAVPPIVREK